MFHQSDKEEAELRRRYPEGSPERRILDYSRATHSSEPVPPFLKAAFRILMGVASVMAIISTVTYLNT